MTQTKKQKLFTEKQAGEFLGISSQTIRIYRFRGRINPTTSDNGVVQYTERELKKFRRMWAKTIERNALQIGWGRTRGLTASEGV